MLLGSISADQLHLTEAGEVVADEWERLARIREEVTLEEFLVMPNHTHALLVLDSGSVTEAEGPTRNRLNPLKGVIDSFRAGSTAKINKLRHSPRASLWESKAEIIEVVNPAEERSIREYLKVNVATWRFDKYYQPG